MTADVCAYRRFIGPNLAVDSRWETISPLACRHLAGVWVRALNKGDYVRIELRLTDGSIVIVKKLKPKPDRHWSFNCAGDIRPGPLLPPVEPRRGQYWE